MINNQISTYLNFQNFTSFRTGCFKQDSAESLNFSISSSPSLSEIQLDLSMLYEKLRLRTQGKNLQQSQNYAEIGKKALYKFKSQDLRYRIMKSKSIKSCFTLSTYSGITYKISLRIAMEAVRKAMKRRRCGFDCIQIHLLAVDVITPNQKQFVLKKLCHVINF